MKKCFVLLIALLLTVTVCFAAPAEDNAIDLVTPSEVELSTIETKNFFMTETMFVALISACSALVGAVTGAFAVIWSSRESSKAQLQEAAIQKAYDARYSAFTTLLNAHSAFLGAPGDQQILENFLSAVDRACLTASPETAVFLLMLRDCSLGKLKDDGHAVADAVVAMQRDLSNFTAPKISRNLWPNSLRKERSKGKKTRQ